LRPGSRRRSWRKRRSEDLPDSCPVSAAMIRQERQAAIEGVADQQGQKNDSLQHQHGGIRHLHPPLHQPARSIQRPDQDGHRDDGQRVLPGEEGDQDAGKAVARGERGVGLSVDGGDLEETGQPGAGACDGAAGQRPGRPTGRPCACAARRLPPVDAGGESRRWCASSGPRGRPRAPCPPARPQWTDVPEHGHRPAYRRRRGAWVEGLLAEAGSRSATFDRGSWHDGDGDVG
jgi:hypothetical protein